LSGGDEAGEGGVGDSGADLADAGLAMGDAGVDDGEDSGVDDGTHVDASAGGLKTERRNSERRVFANTDLAHSLGVGQGIFDVPPTKPTMAGAAAMAKPPIPAVSVMALSPRSGFASAGE
jgi:hypothetical protein